MSSPTATPMNLERTPTPFAQLTSTVTTCRAALPRKRGVVLRICVRRVLGGLYSDAGLSDPHWQEWDGTRRGLAVVLDAAGVKTSAEAGFHRVTLAATHHAVAFDAAAPASRDITDVVRQLLAAGHAMNRGLSA